MAAKLVTRSITEVTNEPSSGSDVELPIAARELVFRVAAVEDAAQIASWNQQLIRDEGNDNAMSLDQLESRMRDWIAGDYRALVFDERTTPGRSTPVSYALFRETMDWIHLRQFFVLREHRRRGIGARAVALLRNVVFTSDKPVIVEAMTWNHPALAFWRAVGFADRYVGLESRSAAALRPSDGWSP